MKDKKELWQQVKQTLGDERYTMGPYFSYQALHTPRHLLFTLARYKFATKMLGPKRPQSILELGCGEGFGTLLLAEEGHRVTAVDFDEEAVAHAKASIPNQNVQFIQSSFFTFQPQEASFDAVVSLDVIEHIDASEEDKFLELIYKALKPGGVAIIGTPNITASAYASKQSEIGHINLFSQERLHQLMSKYFQNVFNFGLNDEVVHTGFPSMCHYLVSVACNKSE